MSSDTTRDSPDTGVLVVAAGQRVRICVKYQSALRALLWLKVAQDGSLYTGFSVKPSQNPRRLIPTDLPDGRQLFTWSAIEPIEDPDDHPQLSIHASGVIRSAGGRSVGVNLRLLTQRTYLCTYLPRHPEHWPIVSTVKRGDATIERLLADECPITVDLFYQPVGKSPMLVSDLERGCFVVRIGYEEVEAHGRVLLHLLFRRHPTGEVWPPIWALAVPHIEGQTKPSEIEQWFESGI